MALGRREGSDQGMWIATNRLARSPGHPFYERLNGVLGEAVNVHERPRFDAGLVTALHPTG